MRRTVALLLVFLAATAAATAQARPLPDGGVTGPEVAAVLQEKGYKADVTTDKDGDPMIRSGSGGVSFLILYFECNGRPRCSSIQFYAGFKKSGISPARIAEWNSRKRFGRAYLDKQSDPRVEMDVDLEHGATTEAVANHMERWVAVLAEFTRFIGW